eukprot:363493-Chlamydomonas_euryale.AAC.8
MFTLLSGVAGAMGTSECDVADAVEGCQMKQTWWKQAAVRWQDGGYRAQALGDGGCSNAADRTGSFSIPTHWLTFLDTKVLADPSLGMRDLARLATSYFKIPLNQALPDAPSPPTHPPPKP